MTKTKKPRYYISPSDLTFLFGECKRCFWLKYHKGISTPGFMPLVGPMSAMQEAYYRNKPSKLLDSQLPDGSISRFGEAVESTSIVINGEETRWRIKGKFDLVVEYNNGTVGLVDCKVTTSTMDDSKVAHYQPQLEAYCYALENPLNGTPALVAHSGLMMWKVAGTYKNETECNVFNTEAAFLMVPRDPESFQRFVEEVIVVLDGHIPDSDTRCKYCAYVDKRQEWSLTR